MSTLAALLLGITLASLAWFPAYMREREQHRIADGNFGRCRRAGFLHRDEAKGQTWCEAGGRGWLARQEFGDGEKTLCEPVDAWGPTSWAIER